MFTTPQDFVDLPYNLPKITETEKAAKFTTFINRNEPIELRQVLGGTFYKALITGVSALPASYNPATNYGINSKVLYGSDIYKSLVINNTGITPDSDGTKWELQPSDRWAKLMVGESYKDINDAEQNWIGLKELLKPLIYGLWLRDFIDTSVQETGVVQASTENAKNITSAIRFSDALETYSINVGKLENCETDTLYNYLYTNSSKFDDIVGGILLVDGDFKNYLLYYFTNPGFVNDFNF